MGRDGLYGTREHGVEAGDAHPSKSAKGEAAGVRRGGKGEPAPVPWYLSVCPTDSIATTELDTSTLSRQLLAAAPIAGHAAESRHVCTGARTGPRSVSFRAGWFRTPERVQEDSRRDTE